MPSRDIELHDGVLVLSPMESKILRAFLHDGADTATVARRSGYAVTTANNTLTNIARAADLSRTGMLAAVLHKRLGFRTVELAGRRRTVGAAC